MNNSTKQSAVYYNEIRCAEYYNVIQRAVDDGLFRGSHEVLTPQDLVEEIIMQLDTTGKSILVLFNIEFIVSLIYTKNVDPSKITFYSDNANKNKLAQHLGVTLVLEVLDTPMKFDVVVGNPPYQKPSEGASTGAPPVYHYFVEKSKKIGKTVALIIPSRWFVGGMGLDSFRKTMLNDRQIRKIVDYPCSKDCFKTVFVAGGVCYFIWERDTTGDCIVINRWNDKEAVSTRALNEFDKFVRFGPSIPILKRILGQEDGSLMHSVSLRTPFGIPTNFKQYKTQPFTGSVTLYGNKTVGHMSRELITKNTKIIDKYKVLLPKAGPNDGGIGKILAKPMVVDPGSCCTETYIVCGTYNSRTEAENLAAYIRTRFVRFLVSLRKLTQDNPRDRFLWVPDLPMTRTWTDQDLYQRYSLTPDEIEHIEQTVRPM